MVKISKSRKLKIKLNYKKLLVSNGKPKNELANPLNLFDDFNDSDALWFNFTVDNLDKLRMKRNS